MSLYDRANVCKTLVCLLQGIEGHRTTIELRNENAVVGTIDSVDARMNMNLSDAEFHTIDGHTTRFDKFFVRGLQIRFVHIPDEVDMKATIHKRITQEQNIAKKGKFEKKKKKTKTDTYKNKVEAAFERMEKAFKGDETSGKGKDSKLKSDKRRAPREGEQSLGEQSFGELSAETGQKIEEKKTKKEKDSKLKSGKEKDRKNKE